MYRGTVAVLRLASEGQHAQKLEVSQGTYPPWTSLVALTTQSDVELEPTSAYLTPNEARRLIAMLQMAVRMPDLGML